MYPYIDAQVSANQLAHTCNLSLPCHSRLGFVINLQKLVIVPSLHLGALIDTAGGLVFPSPPQIKMIIHAAQGLLGLTQVSAIRLHQVTGLLASCYVLVPMYMFHRHPLSSFLRDHFDMRVDCSSKPIPLSSPIIRKTMGFWSYQELVSHGVPLPPPLPTHVHSHSLHPISDGAVCGPLTARGVWSSDQSSLHINFLQLKGF